MNNFYRFCCYPSVTDNVWILVEYGYCKSTQYIAKWAQFDFSTKIQGYEVCARVWGHTLNIIEQLEPNFKPNNKIMADFFEKLKNYCLIPESEYVSFAIKLGCTTADEQDVCPSQNRFFYKNNTMYYSKIIASLCDVCREPVCRKTLVYNMQNCGCLLHSECARPHKSLNKVYQCNSCGDELSPRDLVHLVLRRDPNLAAVFNEDQKMLAVLNKNFKI